MARGPTRRPTHPPLPPAHPPANPSTHPPAHPLSRPPTHPPTHASHPTTHTPGVYAGLDRFEARKRLWGDMKELGLVIKEEPYQVLTPMGA